MIQKRASGHRLGMSGYASILRALQLSPSTASEVAESFGLFLNTAREVLRSLHAMKLVHVGSWRERDKGFGPVWAVGEERDAPHPNPGFTRSADAAKNMTPTAITLAYLMRALAEPRTVNDLHHVAGGDVTELGRFLKHCKGIGLVRIASWSRGEKGGQPAALWVLGSAPSVPKPSAKPRAEINRDARLRRRSRDEYLLAASTFARRGEELPQSKLDKETVEQIRSARAQREKLRQYIADNLSNEALAKKHGVHLRTIEKAITNESWSHV